MSVLRRRISRSRSVGLRRRLIIGLVAGIGLLLAAVGSPGLASAASSVGPWWGLDQSVLPTFLGVGHSGRLVVRAVNVGDGPGEGAVSPVVIKDTLPAGLHAVGISGTVGGWYLDSFGESHSGAHGTVNCTLATLTCTLQESIPPFDVIEVTIVFSVQAGAASSPNNVSVHGGGAPPASRSQQVTVNAAPVPFGVEEESYNLASEDEGGLLATQAGSHPFQLTTALVLNNTGTGTLQPAQPRDENFELPAGLVGDAQAVPQCTLAQFDVQVGNGDGCPADTAVGVAAVWLSGSNGIEEEINVVPVFNLVPGVGEPARFGVFPDAPVAIDTSLRTGSDYGVTASVKNISQGISVLASSVTLWGNPGSPTHDSARGWQCLELSKSCATNTEQTQIALLSMPTACQTSRSPMTINSWSDGEFLPLIESSLPLSVDGCNHEQFQPEIEVQPTTGNADTPSGMNVHLKIPQEAGETPEGVTQADVRNTTVTLPAGLQINPAAAAGLTACSESDIGFLELEKETGRPLFTEETEAERLGEEPHKNECPEAARIGKVTVHSKLLPEPLTGYVYQATQNENPFGTLLALYIVAEDHKAGVRARLPGKVEVQPNGQLVSTFDQTPQVPFEEFTLEFFAGSKAPLASTTCGTYTTTSIIEPWSSLAPGEILAEPSSLFDVTSGPDNTPCTSLGSFTPAFSSGTTNNDAGAFSPFKMTLTRKDGEQTLSTVTVTMPPGLAGMIANVQPCPEAQVDAADCPAASKIGHIRVGAGVGSEPISLPEAGKAEDPIYLTGPYKGAPFGVSIIAHAEAGPFNLGTVNIRGSINVNPQTAQVTIQSEPAPTRLQGIPLDIREVEVMIDRPSFIFNPTNCRPTNITATIGSAEGTNTDANSHFEAADCASLPFRPSFQTTTHAKYTRRDGAYLRVNVTSTAGQANIKSVYVELPKILPSRQETLKLACAAAQYNTNPASCPANSRVGTVIAHTPVLPVPLTGPATLVSHGGAGFPNIDLTLQGDGITIQQTGEVNIARGITSTSFNAVPDDPISSIEMVFPTGAYSILTATANLCTQITTKRTRTKHNGKSSYHVQRMRQKRILTMPTIITAQNGVTIKQNTVIAVEGCGKTAKGPKASK